MATFKLQREGDYVASVSGSGGRLRDIWHITGLTVGESRAQIASRLLAYLALQGWNVSKDGLPLKAIKIRKKSPGTAANGMVIYATSGFGGGGGLPVAYSRTDGYQESHDVPVFYRINDTWDERKITVRRPVRGLIANQRVDEFNYIARRNEALKYQGHLRDFGVGLGLYLLEDVEFKRLASNEIRAELRFVQTGPVLGFPAGIWGNDVDVPELGELEQYRRVESDGVSDPSLGPPVTPEEQYPTMPAGALSWVNFNA